MRRSVRGQALWSVVVLAIVVAACSGSGSDDATPTATPTGGPSIGTDGSDGIFSIRLSQGTALRGPADPTRLVTGDPLDQATIDAVLARLPEWSTDPDNRSDFNRPADSLPRPRIGETVEQPFPLVIDDGPVDAPSGPLHVLRVQPEGDVTIAPTVTITFDQPMVPIGTLAQLGAVDVPVTLAPTVAGTWEWIGTRTLRFEHDSDLLDRLPMATSYTVEIPAGTTSATGGVLARTERFTFETPPPSVLDFGPTGENLPLEPLFHASFDQRIDPAAALAHTTLEANGTAVDIRLATEDELTEADLAYLIGDGRSFAFRPTGRLPAGASLSIVLGPDFPSAEGPNTAPETFRRTARTYGPLAIHDTWCERLTEKSDCIPLSPVGVTLTNPLDLQGFDDASVTVEPVVDGFAVAAYGERLELRGAFKGRTTYTVTLAATLRDIYGQTLGRDTGVEFRFGDARPMLTGPWQEMVTLDPMADPGLTVAVVNHDRLRIRVYAVSPTDYPRYRDQNWDLRRGTATLGRLVSDDTVDTNARHDELTDVFVDLAGQLDGGIGQLLVRIEPDPPIAPETERYWASTPVLVWVQGTHIGLDSFNDGRNVVVWTTDLRTGDPLDDIGVAWRGAAGSTNTNAEGIASLPAPSSQAWGLVATSGTDTAILPSWTEAWRRGDTLRWYVFDDRSLYRPGETVHLKGFVRRWTGATDAQLALVGDGRELTYVAYDPQGNQIATGSAAVSALGGFDLAFAIPEAANLGFGWVELKLPTAGADGASNSHQFQVQEFRRPEFEVRARPESEGPFLAAEPATVAVDAQYFAGGPLPDAAVTWRVTSSDTNYSPPNWDDFQFGVFTPWWSGDAAGGARAMGDTWGADIGIGPIWPGSEVTVEEFAGRTGSDGSHYLRMDFGGTTDLPVTVSAEAQVTDVNRQVWASTTTLLVHPGQLYVGLRGARTFVRQGEALDIEAIVTDIDGNAVSGRPLTIEAARLEWQYVDGEWTEVPVDTESCTVTTGAEPALCTLATGLGGQYRISSTVVDDAGRGSRSELTRWVSGGSGRPDRSLQQEAITLVPDHDEYQPGDVAEVLVDVPFGAAELLVTISRDGILSTQRLHTDEGSAVVRVPITEAHVPALHIQVDAVGATTRVDDRGEPIADAPPRPAFAVGTIDLRIPPLTRTLAVTAQPESAILAPGAQTTVEVQVRDSAGRPAVGAEVALVVVDEAVLALSRYQLADPLSAFYVDTGSDLSATYGRSSIVLADPDTVLDGRDANDGAAGSAEATADAARDAYAPSAARIGLTDESTKSTEATPIDVRTDFDALAVFAPDERTGADGTVAVTVSLPDNLTRYRVMAVAVDGADHFGSGESTITARLPLMVRPAAPRFLNFGDTLDLPIVVQNQSETSITVDVVVQTDNLTLTDGAGRRITVPANDRVEVRFPAAAVDAGTASFRAVAVTSGGADAAVVTLPVYTPATTEAFATYGQIDKGAIAQPILAPTDVFPQFGGLELNTSSTAVQALTDAVIYLDEYRYDNADGYACRILAISALRDVFDAFDAEGMPSPGRLDARVRADISALVALQQDDGGFGTWGRYDVSSPFRSAQAIHALVEAKANGYAVPTDALELGHSYLLTIEAHIPRDWDDNARSTVQAYALFVRDLSGDRDAAEAQALYRRYDLSLDALAWIWPVVTDPATRGEIARTFANRSAETAGAATFTTSYTDDAYVIMASDRRTDGIVLGALLSEDPGNDLIPKVVAGLMASQQRGRWDNVQENAFILLALNTYFDTFEAQDPDFVARVWLGDTYAAEHEYAGRTVERNLTLVPMAELVDAGATDLVIDKDGVGRLYYRVGLRYSPTDLDLDALDRGFVVQRRYEGVDDPSDVRRDATGTWHVKAGAEVRVRLTLVADSRRTDVALIDPLPAGFEPLNPALVGTPTPQADDTGDVARPVFDSWWYWSWFDHQNLRDDRAEAFSSVLDAGTYEYVYVARATTPGSFVVPPARAEEMYAPETFGRSAGERVIVED